jgi:spore coat protein U-like protein
MKVLGYRNSVIGAVAATALLVGNTVQAATVSTTMTVTATVVASCSVNGGTLGFGSYDPLSASPTDGSLQISVACTKGVTAQIGLSTGSNASAGVRRMSNGADFLTYELYKDANHTTVWGNTGTDRLAYTSTTNVAQSFTVEGRVSSGQNVPAGAFNDTVTITVTF